LPDIPIYGYGAMLFLALVFCTLLASRLAVRQGIAPQHVQDLAIWIFVCGILGARVTYMIQYHQQYQGLTPLQLIGHFFKIWEGGLVFYGSAVGGVAGYFLAYVFVLRRHRISSWKMADVIAPCVALGLALGRVGCLLNGCCFGNVACPDCWGISFPLSAPPRYLLVKEGYQTAAGFTIESDSPRTVAKVEPGSDAERKGLKPGDLIVKADGRDIQSYLELTAYLGNPDEWPRGKNDLSLTVDRAGTVVPLPSFYPETLRLHPTQLYETISMALLLGVLLAYWPFRRRDGELMVILMLAYAVHRFLNEILRDDTPPLADGLTLSQNGSVLVFLAGLVLLLWLWRRPPQYRLVPDHPGGGETRTVPERATIPQTAS
jgi:phosphatidylglycerol:prolipoprotein diacylglycerol transferase